MAEYLSPHQYGVAVPGGTEMMTHLIQICLHQHSDLVILKLDGEREGGREKGREGEGAYFSCPKTTADWLNKPQS